MHRWIAFTAIAGLVLATSFLAWDWFTSLSPAVMSTARYVGRSTCVDCHQPQHELWTGSDHDRAMELASDESVLADFNDTSITYQGVTTRFYRRDGKFMVNTEGPDGHHHDYEIKYTFGVRPLQQFMVEFPDGRVQVLREAWDTTNRRWFFVTPPDVTDERIKPGDPLHWTGIAQNWNTTCADCHSTDVHKNYHAATNTYHTTFEEIDVSCEACHGPGSVHVTLARSWTPFWDRNVGNGLISLKNKADDVQLETCARCHARRYQIHEDFRPGRPFLDYYEPSLLLEHLYHADGQILDEVYEYGSFLQSKMYANRVRCSDCHDPHSLQLKFTGNRLCLQCHLPAKYDTPGHHHHRVDSAGAKCIECHMPSRLYMVIDARRDHSFRVPRPDLSVTLGTPNACNDCHTRANETVQWAADTVKEWYGPTETKALAQQDESHWAPAFAAGRKAQEQSDRLLLSLIRRKTTPEMVRATAVDLLANYTTHGSLVSRQQALESQEPLVRLAGVRTVFDESGPTLATDLASRLDDPLRAVRIAAAARLAFMPLAWVPGSRRQVLERAFAEFRKSQELSLDHAGGHLSLGSWDRQLGRAQSAITHFRAAIQLEPYRAGARGELASVLQETGGDPAEIRRLRQEEVQLLQRDAGLVPDNTDIRYQLGLLHYLLDDLDAAQAALSDACRRSPQNYEYRMALALLLENRYERDSDDRFYDQAVATLTELHDLRPADPRAKQILARLENTRQSRQKK